MRWLPAVTARMIRAFAVTLMRDACVDIHRRTHRPYDFFDIEGHRRIADDELPLVNLRHDGRCEAREYECLFTCRVGVRPRFEFASVAAQKNVERIGLRRVRHDVDAVDRLERASDCDGTIAICGHFRKVYSKPRSAEIAYGAIVIGRPP